MFLTKRNMGPLAICAVLALTSFAEASWKFSKNGWLMNQADGLCKAAMFLPDNISSTVHTRKAKWIKVKNAYEKVIANFPKTSSGHKKAMGRLKSIDKIILRCDDAIAGVVVPLTPKQLMKQADQLYKKASSEPKKVNAKEEKARWDPVYAAYEKAMANFAKGSPERKRALGRQRIMDKIRLACDYGSFSIAGTKTPATTAAVPKSKPAAVVPRRSVGTQSTSVSKYPRISRKVGNVRRRYPVVSKRSYRRKGTPGIAAAYRKHQQTRAAARKASARKLSRARGKLQARQNRIKKASRFTKNGSLGYPIFF